MDSSNHQPYKSKLFNFVNRQSWQWRDRLIRSAQYLRVGVEWSLQILIYPIYLMVQAGRVIPKQLRQGFTQKALPTNKNNTVTSPAKVDQPLRRVLQETERCLTQSKSQQKKRNNNNNKMPIMVQGMANEIKNHNLVLVAEDNTIIDILSEAQQKHLKKYISLETANYLYNLKQDNKVNLGLTNNFSTKGNHVLPPIRWFWKVMVWMQTGTLAMNIDLFGESFLVPIVPQNTITSLSTNSQFSQQENNIKSLQLSSYFSEKIQLLREYIKHKSNESLNIENEDPFRIEFLIYAAVDYFFNQVIPHKQLASDLPRKQLKSSIVSADNFIGETMDEPWLSGDVLEQQLSVVNIPSSFQSSPALLSQSELSSHQAKKDFKRKKRKKVSAAKKKKYLGKSLVNSPKTNNSQKSITSKSKHKIEKISSHYIETEAKTTGYVKHPLVRILEWLDSAIHWLEKLINRLSKLLRKKR